MTADLNSQDAALKDKYTPEQIALARPKDPPKRKVSNHLRRLVKEKD